MSSFYVQREQFNPMGKYYCAAELQYYWFGSNQTNTFLDNWMSQSCWIKTIQTGSQPDSETSSDKVSELNMIFISDYMVIHSSGGQSQMYCSSPLKLLVLSISYILNSAHSWSHQFSARSCNKISRVTLHLADLKRSDWLTKNEQPITALKKCNFTLEMFCRIWPK